MNAGGAPGEGGEANTGRARADEVRATRDEQRTDGPAAPLAPGERRVFYSPPVLRTSILLSILLLVFFLGLWFLLEAEIRAMFTAPQVGTLVFFMVVMWAIMLGVGTSRLVATDEGIRVRNWLVSRSFAWDEIEGISFGSGDSWPYLHLRPTGDHPEGRTHMVLGIQRAEGPEALVRAREVATLIRQHRPSTPDAD